MLGDWDSASPQVQRALYAAVVADRAAVVAERDRYRQALIWIFEMSYDEEGDKRVFEYLRDHFADVILPLAKSRNEERG